MKKIMVLGGGGRQLYPLLEAAKGEGYYVILCGNILHENAISLVDKHYNVDCTDKKVILEIAKNEKIDGVIGNAEYAMQYVSYIAEELGLIGNSCTSVEILNDKSKFRKLQKELGLYCPNSFIVDSFEEAIEKLKFLKFPVIMKPDESSSSTGTKKILDNEEFVNSNKNFEFCKNASRNKKVVIEEYVNMPADLKVLEGDIFIHNGIILWEGISTERRNPKVPLVPMTQIWPSLFTEEQLNHIKSDITLLLKNAGVTFGQLNIEMYFSNDKDLFCIEINARQGGMNIPKMVNYHSGIDLYKLLVTTCVGDDSYFNKVLKMTKQNNYIVNYAVFAYEKGIYDHVYINDSIKAYVKEVVEYINKGEEVTVCNALKNEVAYVTLQFDSRNKQMDIFNHIENLIYPVLK